MACELKRVVHAMLAAVRFILLARLNSGFGSNGLVLTLSVGRVRLSDLIVVGCRGEAPATEVTATKTRSLPAETGNIGLLSFGILSQDSRGLSAVGRDYVIAKTREREREGTGIGNRKRKETQRRPKVFRSAARSAALAEC